MTATDLAIRPLGGTRVVVATGDPDDSASLTAMLRLNGFDAREARPADDVLGAVAETRPAVLVTDLNLTSDGDRCEFVRRVRQLPKPPAVVVVTGDTAGSVRRAALSAGAAAFLLKPADPAELVGLISRLSDGP